MPALALSPAVDPVDVGGGARGGAAGTARVQSVETVQALQARIDSLQRTRLDSRLMPTHEALADLPRQVEQGYTSICVKPAMFCRTVDEVPDLIAHLRAAGDALTG